MWCYCRRRRCYRRWKYRSYNLCKTCSKYGILSEIGVSHSVCIHISIAICCPAHKAVPIICNSIYQCLRSYCCCCIITRTGNIFYGCSCNGAIGIRNICKAYLIFIRCTIRCCIRIRQSASGIRRIVYVDGYMLTFNDLCICNCKHISRNADSVGFTIQIGSMLDIIYRYSRREFFPCILIEETNSCSIGIDCIMGRECSPFACNFHPLLRSLRSPVYKVISTVRCSSCNLILCKSTGSVLSIIPLLIIEGDICLVEADGSVYCCE